jgi:hypothetical protein
MTEFLTTLSIESLAHFHPSEVLSTGYDHLDLTFVNMKWQSEDGYGLVGNANNDDYLPSAALGVAGSTDLQDGTTVDIGFYLSNYLLGEGWEWMRNTLISATWSDIADFDVFEFWVKNYRYGVRLQHIWKIQDDGSTAATTITELLDSINWSGAVNDRHYQYVRRWAYVFGLRDADKFPALTDSIKDAATQTSWNRITEIMAFAAVIEFVFFFILGAAQSDRFAWALGCILAGLLPKKVDVDALATPLEEVWKYLVQPDKMDIMSTNVTNHDGLTDCPFDFSLVDLAAMDEFAQRLDTKYRVPASSLNGARKIYGGGLWEVKTRGNYQRVHFAHLLNLAEPVGSAYTDHGISKWYVGPNTAIVIDLLEDLRRLESDFKQLLSKKHWTWFDVTAAVGDLFTDFSISESLSGFADPLVYRPIRRQLSFADATKTGSNGLLYYSGGEAGSTDASQLDSGAWETGAIDHENWWMQCLIFQDHDPRTALYMGDDWTLAELTMDLFIGMLYHSDEYNDTNGNKFHWYRQRYTDFIDFRDGSFVCHATATSGNAMPRFEDTHDVLSDAVLQLKYGIWADNPSTFVTDRVWQASRPKGFVERHPTRIPNFGNREVKIQLLQMMFSHWGVNSPTAKRDAPPQKDTTPAKVDKVDNTKTEDVKQKDAKEPIVFDAQKDSKSTPPSGVKPPKEGGKDEDE